jgi:hypothetical protein
MASPITAVKGRCPRPLDEGDAALELYSSYLFRFAFSFASEVARILGRHSKTVNTYLKFF